MATAALISVQEYLSTSYEVDCDYVDGELQERNLGEIPHSFIQSILVALFNTNRHEWKIVAGTEARIKVSSRRFRVPDVAVLRRGDATTSIVEQAPLICIEILSPEDRLTRTLERFADYSQMGVEHLWLIDPLSRHAWTISADGSQQRVMDAFAVPGTPIRIDLAEVFAELDDMQSGAAQ
jgi:Uma2 family endonuclease